MRPLFKPFFITARSGLWGLSVAFEPGLLNKHRNFWQDLVLAIAFSMIGIGMKRWKYPRAPLVLGFILGPLAEDFLNKSLFVFGYTFLKRPVVLVLLIMVALSLAYSIWQSVRERQAFKKTGRGFIIAAAFMIIFAAAIIPCPNWPARTRLFPLSVSLAGLAISTCIFFAEISRKIGAEKKKEPSRAEQFKAQIEKPEQAATLKSQGIMILWMALYVGLIVFFWILGSHDGFYPVIHDHFWPRKLKNSCIFNCGDMARHLYAFFIYHGNSTLWRTAGYFFLLAKSNEQSVYKHINPDPF